MDCETYFLACSRSVCMFAPRGQQEIIYAAPDTDAYLPTDVDTVVLPGAGHDFNAKSANASALSETRDPRTKMG